MKRLIIGSISLFVVFGWWVWVAYQYWHEWLAYGLYIVPHLSDREQQAVSELAWFSGIVVLISILLIVTGNRGRKKKRQI